MSYTNQAGRERDPPSIPKKPTTSRDIRLGGVFPIAIRSDELLLNRLLQATEPRIIRAVNQANSSAKHQGANLAKDLNRGSDSMYSLSVGYPHLNIFGVPLPRTPEEIKKIWCVLIPGGFRVVHSLFFGYFARRCGKENR